MAQYPGRLWEPPARFSPLGRLHSHLCVHPPGQAARIPKSICLLSCRGNRARRMGPSPSPSGACLQTVGVHGSATQPPSWARTAESKRHPLLSSSQPPSTPQMGRDRAGPACLLPQALLAPCQGPMGGAHSLGSQPWGPGRARERQVPEHHLTSDSLQPRPRSWRDLTFLPPGACQPPSSDHRTARGPAGPRVSRGQGVHLRSSRQCGVSELGRPGFESQQCHFKLSQSVPQFPFVNGHNSLPSLQIVVRVKYINRYKATGIGKFIATSVIFVCLAPLLLATAPPSYVKLGLLHNAWVW